MFTIKSIHISLEIWGCIFCLIAALCISLNKNFNKRKKYILAFMELSTSVLLVMDSLAWAYRGVAGKEAYYMVRISNFFVFLVTDIIMMLYHAYVCSYIDVKKNHGNLMDSVVCVLKKTGYAVCILGIILIIVSQYTDMYYYFDKNNLYHRNRWYFVSVCIGFAVAAIDFTLIFKKRKQLKKTTLISLLSYIALPFIGSVALLFYYGISLGNIAITISMIFIFIASVVEQGNELGRKQKEAYELKVAVMLSQIGPHFIYNTLSTIKYLCRKDPDKAGEVVDNFADYLRGNIDSLSSKKLVPFENEMKHIESYLAIEKTRFGDRINVIYDIKEKNFLVPPLTLQPLVENAVKHGIIKKEDGGNIWISSYTEDDSYVVEIRDDGVGFDTESSNDDKVHIGIKNAESRIRDLCNGNTDIVSVREKGTDIHIYIPKNR